MTLLFKRQDVANLVLTLNARQSGAEVEMVDAAYWMKGCSSLGKLRFAALVEMGGDGKTRDRVALVDLKEGVDAAAPAAPPAWRGHEGWSYGRKCRPPVGERRLRCGCGDGADRP